MAKFQSAQKTVINTQLNHLYPSPRKLTTLALSGEKALGHHKMLKSLKVDRRTPLDQVSIKSKSQIGDGLRATGMSKGFNVGDSVKSQTNIRRKFKKGQSMKPPTGVELGSEFS